MADEIKSALDAMNAALAGEGDGNQPTGEIEDTAATADGSADDAGALEAGDDQNAGRSAEGDDKAGERGDGEAEGAESEGKGDELPSVAEVRADAEELGISFRHADGKFKSREELAAEVAAAKAAAEGGKPEGKDGKPAKKEPDPINDPLPKGVSAETTQRIRTLIERTKEADTRAEKATNDFNYLVQGVQSTGATPEQYGETLSWLALFNNPDPEKKGQALDLLVGVAERLATSLGRELKFNDPLEAHTDLKQAVQAGQITVQLAREVARSRNQGSFNTQLQTAASERQAAEAAAAQEKEQARVDLNALEQSLRATDKDYDRKREAILPAVEAAFKRLRPGQWKDAFTEIYRNARVAPRPVARPNPGRPAVPAAQPLRGGKNPSGAGGNAGNLNSNQPGSALDAVNAALAKLR